MPSHFTLHLDETGTYQDTTPREPWILAGFISKHDEPLISEEAYDDAREALVSSLNALNWTNDFIAKYLRLRPGQRTQPRPFTSSNIHFTEINQHAHNAQDKLCAEQVPVIALEVLDQYFEGTPLAFIHNGPRHPQKSVNYLAHVLEVVTQAATIVLPNHSRTEASLRSLIAYRDDLSPNQQFADKLSYPILKSALTIGTTSLGLASPNAHSPLSVEFPSAKTHGGLILADLLCGIARSLCKNSRGGFKSDLSSVRPKLVALGYNVLFSHEELWERRARALETSGSLADSLFLYLACDGTDSDIQRLVVDLVSSSKPQGLRYAFEELIQKLDTWANDATSSEVFSATTRLHDQFTKCALNRIRDGWIEGAATSARLQSYALVWANHLGKTEEAATLLSNIRTLLPLVRHDPQSVESLLQAQVGAIENAINRHDFKAAMDAAINHLDALSRLTGLSAEELRALEGSREQVNVASYPVVRGLTSYYRARLLYIRNTVIESDPVADHHNELGSICGHLTYLLETCSMSHQRGETSDYSSQVRILQLMCYTLELMILFTGARDTCATLSQFVIGECLSILESDRQNAFCLYIVLRCFGSATLLGLSLVDERNVNRDIDGHISHFLTREESFNHPNELILREALLVRLISAGDTTELRERLKLWRKDESRVAPVFEHQKLLAIRLAYVFAKSKIEWPPELSAWTPEIVELGSAILHNHGHLDSERACLLALRSTTVY